MGESSEKDRETYRNEEESSDWLFVMEVEVEVWLDSE